MDLRLACFVVSNEFRSVEANETFLRGSPHVAVGGLGQRVYRALRKPLVDSPRPNDVLVERQRRINAEGAVFPNCEDEQKKGPTCCQSRHVDCHGEVNCEPDGWIGQ